MTHEPRTIVVEPGSELDRLLAEVSNDPIVLLRNGSRYRLIPQGLAEPPDEDGPGAYDPERAVAGMKSAAGSWSDVDADELTSYVYQARIEGTRPPDRP